MVKERKKRPRIPKADLRNLRLWAEGARESVLQPHLEGFARAHDKGWLFEREYLQNVCNEFHGRIDWRTEDHEEPEVKDENEWVDEPELPEEEEQRKRARVDVVNSRIRRWFMYRIRRKRRQTSGLDPRKDPFAVLLAKLSGLHAPPKARQAYQQFWHESVDEIGPRVSERWQTAKENNEPETVGRKEPKAGFRAQVVREMFAELSATEKKAIGDRAKSQAAEAKKAYEDALKNPPANTPAARQKCLDALPDFIAPILRGIHEHTGCHALLVIGGPMPKYGGELRTMHVAYGRNRSAKPLHFPQWDRDRFSKQVLNFMVEFLATAFSKQECEAAALATDLDKAEYTMPQDDLPSASDSESDSSKEGSNDDSDSDSSEGPKTKKAKKDRKSSGKSSEKAPRKRRVPANAEPATDSPANTTASAAPMERPARRPQTAPRPTTTTMEMGDMGPVTFLDPTAGINYEDLSLEQKRARNERRNKAYADLIRDGLTFGPDEPAPTPARPRPRARPLVKSKTASRRSNRLSGLPDESAGASDTMDIDDGEAVAPRQRMPSSPRSAPELTVSEGDEGDDDDDDHAMIVDCSGRTTPASNFDELESDHATGNPDDDDGSDEDRPSNSGVDRPPPPRPTTASAAEIEAQSFSGARPNTVSLAEIEGGRIAAPQVLPLPVLPLRAPEWFTWAFKQITEPHLGSHFMAAVAAWTRLETACKFQQPAHRLSTDGRPDEVGKWINGGRGRKGPAPVVTDPVGFGLIWWGWWDGLQPTWRIKDADGRWALGEAFVGEWEDPLLHWGPNGLLSVLGALHFWGCAVINSPEPKHLREWELAVFDVSWILEGLAVFHESFNKRTC